MAHFAEIDENNIVIRVLVVDDRHENNGHHYLSNDCGLGGTWIKTSYNTSGGKHKHGGKPFRKNYAGVGYAYDVDRDAFIPPKPYESWILDEESCVWQAPITCPETGSYSWDEETLSWVEIPTADE